MKDFNKLLKKVLPILLSVFVLTLMSGTIYGQKINKNTAEQEAKQNSREAGFEKIFFSSGVLNGLLSNASGIKFYNGLPNGENRKAVLMAIGLDASGNEIGTVFQQNDEADNATTVDVNVKNLQVANTDGSRRVTGFSSSFNTQDLRDLLDQGGVNGIHFMPAQNTTDNASVMTLTAAAASGSAPAATMSMEGFKSPCPPDCGGQ